MSVLFKSKCCFVKNMLCSACNSFTQGFLLRQTVYFGNRTALCVLGFSRQNIEKIYTQGQDLLKLIFSA